MDLGVAQANHLPRRVALRPAHQQILIAFVSVLSFPTVSAKHIDGYRGYDGRQLNCT